MRVYVLWRHHHGEFELLGAFSAPEKFQAFVERSFPLTMLGSGWRCGNGDWYISAPDWEYVANPIIVDHGAP